MRLLRAAWLALVAGSLVLTQPPAQSATQTKTHSAKQKKAKAAAKNSKATSAAKKKGGPPRKALLPTDTKKAVPAGLNAAGPATETQLLQEARAAKSALDKAPRDTAARERFARAASRAVEALLVADALGDTERAERLTTLISTEFAGVGDPLNPLLTRGDAKARLARGVLQSRGLILPRDVDKACADFRALADQFPASGWLAAQCMMDKESDKAWGQMERAASGGHAIAQEWMGRRCLGEFGATGKDYECAREWLTFSASQGRPRSQTLLAYLLSGGVSGVTDLTRAVKLYRLAADRGDADAMNNLAELHEVGRGVGKNLPEALRLYESAADRGLPAALFNAGRLLAIGVDGRQDLPRARALLTRAEEKGVSQARRVLDWLDQNANASDSRPSEPDAPDRSGAKGG